MGNIFLDTAAEVQKRASQVDSVLVAYSGGKDACCVVDLCVKSFARVVLLHLYPLPKLPWSIERCQFARERWGVEVIEVQDPVTMTELKRGLFCFPVKALRDMPDLSNPDMFRAVAQECGIPLIATGSKKSDGLNTAGTLKKRSERGDFFFPLMEWHSTDVLAFLAHRKIPLPPSDGRRSSSFDLTTTNILWMFDERPSDYEVYRKYFPFIEAVVKRRDWYGVDRKKNRK